MAQTENLQTIEQRFARLDEIITRLEKGNMSLDESIQAYTQGMELALSCRRSLNDMTQQVEAVQKKAQQEEKLSAPAETALK